MRFIAERLGIVATALLIIVPCSADASEWCAQYRSGGSSCSFTSHAQCLTAISGVGGMCNPSPYGSSQSTERASQRARTPAKPRTKAASRRAKEPADTHPPAPVAAPAVAPAPVTPAAIVQPNPTAFAAARKLILDGQYQAGLASMRALRADNNTDVASYVGLAHRKLGRVDEAKSWYGRALAADPNHKLTLAFYGMLQAEQGDLPGAQAVLIRIGRLCGGTECNEYKALQGVISSKIR